MEKYGHLKDENGNILYPISCESGNGEYENYVKFADGTLICYGRKTFGNISFQSTMSRTTINNPFTFPQKFSTFPIVIVSTASDNDYKYATVIGVIRTLTSIDKVDLFCDRAGTGEIILHYIAIGRWK